MTYMVWFILNTNSIKFNQVLNFIVPLISSNLIVAIAVASVATILVTGVVYADEKNGKPFEAIWEAIYNLESTPDNGITDAYRVENPKKITGGTTDVMATCNEGDIVLGGGFEIEERSIAVIAEKPSTNSDGNEEWLVSFNRASSVTEKDVKAYAICATP